MEREQFEHTITMLEACGFQKNHLDEISIPIADGHLNFNQDGSITLWLGMDDDLSLNHLVNSYDVADLVRLLTGKSLADIGRDEAANRESRKMNPPGRVTYFPLPSNQQP